MMFKNIFYLQILSSVAIPELIGVDWKNVRYKTISIQCTAFRSLYVYGPIWMRTKTNRLLTIVLKPNLTIDRFW